MPTALAHSHRPTTKVAHKPFKSKAASKHELRDRAKGRVPNEKGLRKTPHQQVMSKLDRRNQAKQVRMTKHKEHLKGTSIFNGREGAPRIVAVLPLCPDGDATAAIQQLNDSLDIQTSVQPGNFRVSVDRFKQKLQYIPLQRDLTECLNAARVADFVIVVLSATVEVDPLGELILRSVESQGLSTIFTVCQGLDKIEPSKQRPGVVSSLKSFITHFHPEQEKVFSLDSRQECAFLMRSLCGTTPKGVRWRDERSWMLAEDIQFARTDADSTIITGVVRGRSLKADRLVQVGDWGTFQIEKIVAAPLTTHGKGKATQTVEEEQNQVIDVPSNDCDDLNDLAPVDVIMDDEEPEQDISETTKKGVLLDDHHYFSEGDEEEKQIKKRVPKGTSKYQSAWYLDDVSDSESESDMEDIEMEDSHAVKYEAAPEDGAESYARPETVAEPSEYPQSEMMEELAEAAEAEQLAQYRSTKRDEAEDDKEFPDEIELPPQALARERLSRYRGLKSLRTSAWQEDEDRAHEPENWRQLLQIPNYASSKARAVHEALAGGVEPGTRVQIHVRGVPPSLAQSHKPGASVTLFSLFRHEHKKTVVNYLFRLSADHDRSIKSKEELIVQCGPRRMVINPLFSLPGTTPNDVHKYARFLHPGDTAVATFTGPLTWGSVPVLFFRRTTPGNSPPSPGEKTDGDGAGEDSDRIDPGLALVGTGTTLPPSTSRVIAKRVILTGHPYHIGKKAVVVRFMFFNREDVDWFKAMPLWTRRGRRGYVKEPLGTRGYFKATFDGRVNPQDSVGISLYKRVWPRVAKPLDRPLLDVSAAVSGEEETDGDLKMA